MKTVTTPDGKVWYYDCKSKSSRGILGTVGNNPLICIGCNCSTAKPGKLDPTLAQVQKVAGANGYDSFIMLNLSSFRATKPKDLPKGKDADAGYNKRCFCQVLGKYPDADIWCAWGSLAEKRKYLKQMIEWIRVTFPKRNYKCRGRITKSGNPHHPLYVKNTELLKNYDI